MNVTPIVPSLELSVTNNSDKASMALQCSCTHQQFDVGNGDQLVSMIKE